METDFGDKLSMETNFETLEINFGDKLWRQTLETELKEKL